MTRPRRLLTALLAVGFLMGAVLAVGASSDAARGAGAHSGSEIDHQRSAVRSTAPGSPWSTAATRGRAALDALLSGKRVVGMPASFGAALLLALVWLGYVWLGLPTDRGTRRRFNASGRAPPRSFSLTVS